MGDFNLPSIDWHFWNSTSKNKFEIEFINKLQDCFLMQNVLIPTRARGEDNPHILDLVITNEDFLDIKNTSPLGKSDHSVLLINCNIQVVIQNKEKLNLKKGDYDGLKNALDIDWEIILEKHHDDVNSMWVEFKNIIIKNCEKFIPKTNNFDNWKKASWKCPLQENVRKIIKIKDRKWTRYLETKNNDLLKEYKTLRNRVRNETRCIIKNEQMEIAKASENNPKKFWNYIKSKTKNSSSIGDIKYKNINGEELLATTDEEKSKVFCDYFSSVFTIESDNFEPLQDKNEIKNVMTDISFNAIDIQLRLGNLNVNKSQGPDNIYPKILKEANEVLAKPLQKIFETSFKMKQIPLDWKTADISAIFKKGNKLDVGNYRPISLTCICCKIMESIIRDHIFKYFIDNKLFSSNQFGFIKGRSTVLQLLKVLDEWTKSLELGGQVDVIYTDFAKAFDKVPHKRLIHKLKYYRIDPNIVEWIEAFLSSRKQRVKVNGIFSSWQSVLSGIPQGSILGPLLFIIFINDLAEMCDKESKLYLYADDAKIFSHICNIKDKENLQSDLDKVNEWSNKWLLKLNIQKCKVMSYGRDCRINSDYYLCCNDTRYNLEKLDSINDLGVIFDKNLKFDSHIDKKVNKAYSILGLINRNFRNMNLKSFVLIYKSMVRSHVEYANSVWSPYKIMDIEKIEKVQKRATKMINSIKNLTYENRLRMLNLPTLKYRRLRGDMIEVYKIITEKYDTNSAVNMNICTNSYTRGNRYKMFPVNVHYNLRKNNFCNRIIAVWNSLPDDVVAARNTNTFKNLLDKFWNKQEVKFNWRAELTETGSRSLKV